MRAGNCLAWDLIKCIFHIKVEYAKNFVFYEEKHEIILYCPCGHAGIFCGADTGIFEAEIYSCCNCAGRGIERDIQRWETQSGNSDFGRI